MAEHRSHNEHGNTPAGWTAVILMVIGFVVGAIAVIQLNWPLFWIGGVGVVVLGAIVGKVMQMMGMGQPLPAEQQGASPSTAPDYDG
ncbi:MAG TPA: HGxxPAAW family protein [Jiangellaceae bacterium]|nr:HGxxPAAW family protein [Jiangellaceae bacterium]